MDGEKLVLFMTDDDLEDLIPLRILHHPGVALEVVVGSYSVETASAESSALPPVYSASDPVPKKEKEPLESPTVPHSPDVRISVNRQTERASISSVGRGISALSLTQGDTSHVTATGTGLEEQMELIQQQPLKSLSTVHHRIQNIIFSNHELYENPLPRLFFILPKASQACNNPDGPASKQFRLYFLCDCGQHTATYISKIRHEVHVAKHEGYDLERPKEFIERYGLYTMAMMQMMKYGFEGEGVVVPQLTESDLTESIEGAQRHINFATNNITLLIDETISFIQDLRGDIGGYPEDDENKTELDKSREREDLDLQQIDSYLSIENKEQTLGNLSRIITRDRHVRWVCNDHNREIYRESVVQELREFVDANQGTFIEEKGRIIMKIKSRAMATEFYSIMSKNCGIQELETAFEFNASLKDLGAFSSAVTKANILSLNINGQNIKAGNVSCSQTYGPIMEIMCNKQIQSIQLQKFKDLHLYTNIPTVNISYQLRVLLLDSLIPFMDGSANSFFTRVLESCPHLVEMRLQTDHICFPYYLIMEKIDHLKMLKTVVIRKAWYELALAFISGQAQAVSLRICDLRFLSEFDRKFTHDGHLTSLTVERTPVSNQESCLTDIISKNQNLANVNIGSHAERSLTVLDLVILARKQSLQVACSPSPLTLHLIDDEIHWGNNAIPHDVILANIELETPLQMSTVVKMRTTARRIKSESVYRLFSLYSWTIKTLETNKTFTDKLAQLLEEGTKERGSKLASLTLDPTTLSPVGLGCLDRVIQRSQDLDHFYLCLTETRGRDKQEEAEWILGRYGSRLDKLALSCNPTSSWISHLTKAVPNRLVMPKLQDFSITFTGDQIVSSTCVDWISTIVSAPTRVSWPNSVSQPRSMLPTNSMEQLSACMPLTSVSLEHAVVAKDDWKKLLESLDFSTLEVLDLTGSNFSLEHLAILAKCIIPGEGDSKVALKILRLGETSLVKSDDSELVLKMCDEIERKPRHIYIDGVFFLRRRIRQH
ncbi:hypothetical protein BGX26_009235 [Mortierella sp. AD094]|nr:hypothetical protein BGX26_009235 [Mortierella sp. AD094]